MSNIVHIAFICDEGYVLPTSVAITSLIMNKEESMVYHIYVVTADLSENSKKIFEEFQCKNVIIHIIQESASDFIGLHTQMENSYCVATEAALLKFKLPELITKTDKVLYLDGDIIVNQDLKELYETPLEENYAAVVVDSGIMYAGDPIKKQFVNYFNSGVMLLNLEKMRTDELSNVLIQEKKNSTDMSLMDQNIFNKVFENHIKILPIKYNVLYINLLRAYAKKKFTIQQLNQKYNTEYQNLNELKEEAVILHYSSKDKPWKYKNVPTVKLWDKYYKASTVKERFPLTRYRVKKEKNGYTQKLLRMIKKEGIRETLKQIYQYMRKYRNNIAFGIPYYIINFILRVRGKIIYTYYKIPKKNGLNETEKRDKDIIVSLTTIPSRIQTVGTVIGCMMRQTVKPDRIILNISEEEFQGIKLPYCIRLQQKNGLEVNYCKDLGPHTKYYYTMKQNPNQIIVTIDDDILYHKDTIELLYQSYQRHPSAVSALRTHLITFDKDGNLNSYNRWHQRWSRMIDLPTIKLFATGVGGVLYPPACMHEELLKEEEFMKLCPAADDLWLKVMQLLRNTPCVLAARQRPLRYIDGTQEVGLYKTNVHDSRNDIQLQAILDVYNEYYGEGDTLLNRIKNDATPIRNT